MCRRHPGRVVALVAETRDVAAFASKLCGLGPASRARIAEPRPSALGHLIVGPNSRLFVDYNVGEHLAG